MSRAHREYFNRLAPEWNNQIEDDPLFIDHLINFGVKRGEMVLDIGCGTGRMSKYIAGIVGEEGLVVAEDISERMLEEGKKEIGNSQILWLCDDVSMLSLKENTFDKIICFSSFPHFLNKLAALKEMRRVLVPSGRLLILHTSSSEELNRFHSSLDGIVKHDRLPDKKTMMLLFKQSGLVPIRIEESENLYWAEGEKI